VEMLFMAAYKKIITKLKLFLEKNIDLYYYDIEAECTISILKT